MVFIPVMTNSMGMSQRTTWNKILRTGHSFVFSRRKARGDKTRVSQAATVSVHTKKYLCAARCGERSSDAGRGMTDMVVGGQAERLGGKRFRTADVEAKGGEEMSEAATAKKNYDGRMY